MIVFTPQENKSGDPGRAAQGFGRVVEDSPPPRFATDAVGAAYDFFAANGFVVLEGSLGEEEVAFLNEFCERTQSQYPERWGLSARRKPHHRHQGLIFSQPLLDHPELDPYTRHPASWPLVARILGGAERVRFAEFNFRETPTGAGAAAMNFHHDAVREDRLLRDPYLPCDWLCAIHYLTDVGPAAPAFCVVPGSNRYASLAAAYDALGDDYREVPIRAPAGSCILYDTALFHTRLDGDGDQGRRTWHQYYGRGGWLKSSLPTTDRYVRSPSPALTDWNLFPERLALHPDPEIRLYFSHWNSAQCEWVASGFDPELRRQNPRGEQ